MNASFIKSQNWTAFGHIRCLIARENDKKIFVNLNTYVIASESTEIEIVCIVAETALSTHTT